jgi:hypothetical protein
MKIFVGTVNIAGQLFDYAKGLSALGHDVTVGAINGSHIFDYKTQNFLNLTQKSLDWTSSLKKLKSLRGIRKKDIYNIFEMIKLINKYDIFIFQWPGISLTYGNIEYPLYKYLNKKLIQICNGDDTRHWSAFLQQYGEDLTVCGDFYNNDDIKRPYTNLRIAELYADLIVSRPSHAGLAIMPYLHFFYPVDLDSIAHHYPDRDVPVIVHAPSMRGVKGSEVILGALDQLRNEGVAFELKLLEGRPNAEVLTELYNADIAIDQILLADYGKFAIEAAASGCAVAVCDDPIRQYIPPNRPFIRIDKKNIVSQLRILIKNKQYRIKCMKECYSYAFKYHECKSVCQITLNALKSPHHIKDEFYIPEFYRELFNSDWKSNSEVIKIDAQVNRRAKKFIRKLNNQIV